MTSCHGNAFPITGPLWPIIGGSPHKVPVIWSFGVFFVHSFLDYLEQAVEQIIELRIIWDSMAFTWRHGNDLSYCCWRMYSIVLLKRPLRLRWWQQGGSTTGFALDNVMIGPACPEMCRGQGICRQGRCYCNEGFQGNCQAPFYGIWYLIE